MSEATTPINPAPSALLTNKAPHAHEFRPAIDSGSRSTVLSLFGSGVFWLLVSTLLNFVSAVKVQFPEFVNWSFLTYGRVTPAGDFVQTYGWCSLGALGAVVWIVLRFSNRLARGRSIALTGVCLWNLGVALGLGSIMLGELRSYNGLEMPIASSLLIFSGFSLIAIWLVLSLRFDGDKIPVGLMFIVGGLCWFSWSFFTGNALLECPTIKGMAEQIVATWVSHGTIWLFLVPLALGIAFFLIPKATGLPLSSGSFGRTCFWMYFLVGGLTCANGLSGGPVPLWLQSLSAASSILLLVPVFGCTYNLLATMRGSAVASVSPVASFSRFGLVVFSIAAGLTAFASLRTVNFTVQLTLFPVGIRALLVQGFVGMVVFGAIYYIMPRLSGCEWISSSLIRIHFLCSAYGIAMGGFMLLCSGVFSGVDMRDPGIAFSQSMQSSAFFYWGRTLSFLLLALGYASFTIHFLLMLCRIGQPEGEATLLTRSNGH